MVAALQRARRVCSECGGWKYETCSECQADSLEVFNKIVVHFVYPVLCDGLAPARDILCVLCIGSRGEEISGLKRHVDVQKGVMNLIQILKWRCNLLCKNSNYARNAGN